MKKLISILLTLLVSAAVSLGVSSTASAEPPSQSVKLASYAEIKVVVYPNTSGTNGTGLAAGKRAVVSPNVQSVYAQAYTYVEIKQANCSTNEPTGAILQSWNTGASGTVRKATNSTVRSKPCLSIYTKIKA